jgi:hypothetical protein
VRAARGRELGPPHDKEPRRVPLRGSWAFEYNSIAAQNVGICRHFLSTRHHDHAQGISWSAHRDGWAPTRARGRRPVSCGPSPRAGGARCKISFLAEPPACRCGHGLEVEPRFGARANPFKQPFERWDGIRHCANPRDLRRRPPSWRRRGSMATIVVSWRHWTFGSHEPTRSAP